MRGTRTLVASFAALAGSWTACSSYGSAPIQDADAAAPVDAAITDAGADTDAASVDCANAIICDDFEQPGDATTGWPLSLFTANVTLETTTEEAKSPTHSLKASATASTTRRQAFLGSNSLGESTVSVEFALLARGPLATYATVASIEIGSAGDHYFHVQLLEDGRVTLYEQRNWPDGGASFGETKTIDIVRLGTGQWRDVRTTANRSPDGGVEVTLTVDGTRVAADSIFGSATGTRIEVGLVYVPAGDNSVSVYFDDIVVRAQ